MRPSRFSVVLLISIVYSQNVAISQVSASCCFPDATCQDLLPAECAAAEGTATSGTCAEQCCARSAGPFAPPLSVFSSVAELCAAFHGFPTPANITPPPNPIGPTFPRDNEPYADQLAEFIRNKQYRNLGWLHDIGWRLTGPIFGEPPSPHNVGEPAQGVSFGTHPAVRIYYSPEVIRWLCRGVSQGHCAVATETPCTTNADCPKHDGLPDRCVLGRQGECSISSNIQCLSNTDCPENETCRLLPPGAMIIKEMHSITSFVVDDSGGLQCSGYPHPPCAVDSDCPNGEECGNLMWLNSECYSEDPDSWAIMVLGHDGSHDGWFWVGLDADVDDGNPPILGTSAVTSMNFFDDDQLFVDHDPSRYPTGQPGAYPDGTSKEGSVVAPNYAFGPVGCLNCHATAANASTFSTLNNILGREDRFPWKGAAVPEGPCFDDGFHNDSGALLGGYCSGGDNDGARCSTIIDCPNGTCLPLIYDFASPLASQHPGFQTAFPPPDGVTPQISTVLNSRFPAESYDHVVTTPISLTNEVHNTEQFITSDQCAKCHDASVLTSVTPNMTRCVAAGCTSDLYCVSACNNASAVCGAMGCEVNGVGCGLQVNISPYAEWRASPMGLAGRDPIFFSQLEGERNLWPNRGDCIDTLCLKCHGVLGQRQLAIDSPGTICTELVEFPMSRPFTRDHVDAWPGKDPNDFNQLRKAKYGALGRDGISCAACHQMSDLDLGKESTFTGNFNTVSADEMIGPYSYPTPPADAPPGAMTKALGVTPGPGNGQIRDSALCGSCHAINLPVLDTTVPAQGGPLIPLICTEGSDTVQQVQICDGQAENAPCNSTGTCQKFFKYEQTTYLEWVNSDFRDTGSTPKSCQECHMPRTFHGEAIATKVANIQDNTYPISQNQVVEELPVRGTCSTNSSNAGTTCTKNSECPGGECNEYGRHTLYGLNVFLNEMFQQFPIILGLRQIDYMNANARPALTTAREAALAQRPDSASVEVSNAQMVGTTVTANVTVTNWTGHKFPSGVGFRRAFIEFVVLDSNDTVLWASGFTDTLGIIQDGTSSTRLDSEFFDPPTNVGCGNDNNNQCYQPHHQIINAQDQVQIYEELVQNNGTSENSGFDNRAFTSSFLQRWYDVKDNRLLPAGWTSTFTDSDLPDLDIPAVTGPHGNATTDPDYPLDGTPATGSDTIRYEARNLDPSQVSKVRARLYWQATPPHYLKSRFDAASLAPPPGFQTTKKDIERLYYLASHLRTDVTADDGEMFIDDWKLPIDDDMAAVTIIISGACCVGTTCSLDTEAGCTSQGGVYQGDDTACLLGTCAAPPTGACCDDATGICTEDETQTDCQGTSRRYGGDGSTCFTIDPRCEPPAPVTGQCCLPDGSCEITTPSECDSEGGDFNPGRSCDGDGDGNGTDDACEGVPAASAWGMMILVLALLVGIATKFGFRRRPTCD